MHDSQLAMDFETQAKIIEAVNDQAAPKDEWISSLGIKFRLKKVSPFVSMEISRKVEDPNIPTFYNSDRERDEENPLDPHYLQAMNDARQTRGMMVMNANLALGTEVLQLPTTVQPVGNTDWSEELDEATNHVIEVPTSGVGRYLAWLRFYALQGSELGDLSGAVLRYSGVVMEADVQSVSENFSGDAPRDTVAQTVVEETTEPRN